MNYEYCNFEDWFYEPEGLSFRSERFFSLFPNDYETKENLKLWVKAAFNSARLQNGNKEETTEDQKPL
jgi:hypothetical protein